MSWLRRSIVLLAALVACLAPQPSAGQTLTLRLAHVQETSDPVQRASEMFRDILAKETKGQVVVKIAPAGQLGDYKQLQENLQQGVIDIVVESIGTLSRFHKAAGIESMPYLFRDYPHYVKVWDGPLGEEIKGVLAKEGNFLVMGHMFRGHRHVTANRPIRTLEDLRGLKIRVSPMKERLVAWKIFGASPTPMAWGETFSALQQGVIDAQENPLTTIVSSSLFEVQKHLSLTAHMCASFTYQFNAKRFASWPAPTQAAVRKAATGSAEWFNKYVAEQEDAMVKLLESKGMTVIRPDLKPFQERAKDVVKEFPELQPWFLKIVAQ
jgi:TRAP-type transport system periplasmic protein